MIWDVNLDSQIQKFYYIYYFCVLAYFYIVILCTNDYKDILKIIYFLEVFKEECLTKLKSGQKDMTSI